MYFSAFPLWKCKKPNRFVLFFALVLILTLKEKRKHKSEKEFESEEKRKSAVTFVTALFFLVAGTGISRRASQSEWT